MRESFTGVKTRKEGKNLFLMLCPPATLAKSLLVAEDRRRRDTLWMECLSVSMGGAKYTASPHHGLSVFYFVYRLYCIQITITGVSIKTGTARNKRNVKETYKQYKDQ